MGLNNNNISAKQEHDSPSPASSPLPSHQRYRISPASSMHLEASPEASQTSQHQHLPNSIASVQQLLQSRSDPNNLGRPVGTTSPKDNRSEHSDSGREMMKIATNSELNQEPQAEDLSNKSSRGGSPLNSQQTGNGSQNRYHPYCHSEILIKSE